MTTQIPRRERQSSPTTLVRSGGDFTECKFCGQQMRWDETAEEYVGVASRYCPALCDPEYPFLAHQPRDSGCAGRTPLPARAAEQALCVLCGYPDSPENPHTPNRRVRDGKEHVEYLCDPCLRAKYGDMVDDESEAW